MSKAKPARARRPSPRGFGLAPARGGCREGRVTVRFLSKSIDVGSADIRAAARSALGPCTSGAISVALVDDATMSVLHHRYMGDPAPTDVLTFDLRDDDSQAGLEGEIVISLDTARRQARRFSTLPVEEVLRYVVHGVLHLLGYDDRAPAERRRMRQEEDRVLSLLSLSRRGRAGGRPRSAPSRRSARRA